MEYHLKEINEAEGFTLYKGEEIVGWLMKEEAGWEGSFVEDDGIGFLPLTYKDKAEAFFRLLEELEDGVPLGEG